MSSDGPVTTVPVAVVPAIHHARRPRRIADGQVAQGETMAIPGVTARDDQAVDRPPAQRDAWRDGQPVDLADAPSADPRSTSTRNAVISVKRSASLTRSLTKAVAATFDRRDSSP